MHYKCNMDWSYNVFIVGTISLGMRLGSSSLISTLGFNRYVHMVPFLSENRQFRKCCRHVHIRYHVLRSSRPNV